MDIKDLVYEVEHEQVTALAKEITYLHERELFEKHIYLIQTKALDGDIIEIVKRLGAQEEEHAYLLKILLERSELLVKEYNKEELAGIIESPLHEAIIYDIEQEKISADAYKDAIAKSSGKLKQVLEHILEEEFEHINLLEKFLE